MVEAVISMPTAYAGRVCPLTWDEIRARRLARSHLLARAPADRLVEVVRDTCGIHAQVMGSAELQLAARVEEITQADVREALWERRSLAKTWTLRGTLHVHPADELSLWTSARRAVEDGGRQDLVAAIGEALRGRRLTREQLADAVVECVPSAPREELASGWGFHLGDAASAGVLCFGPPEGAKVTFVHVEDWLGPQRPWQPDEALREVAARYARSYAPVGLRQLREWLAAKVDVDLPDVPPEPAEGGSVRLLPEYDVYVMGFREREHLVPPAVREQVAAHGKGRYEGPAGVGFLLVDGVAAGLWSRKKGAKRIDLQVEPARRLTKAESAGVEAEAERIGAFYGLEPKLTVSRPA
jgi:Winged helix DNA-binding domain